MVCVRGGDGDWQVQTVQGDDEHSTELVRLCRRRAGCAGLQQVKRMYDLSSNFRNTFCLFVDKLWFQVMGTGGGD